MDEWIPEAELIEDEILDFDEIQPHGDLPDLDDPAVREALEAQMERYEEQWLDEHIPALKDRTPAKPCRTPSAGKRCASSWPACPNPALAPSA